MGLHITQSLLAASLAALTTATHAWSPGVGNESDTSGFTVDTQVRNDVISFWHCVYKESEGYENRINWTGSISSGNAGTTAAAFKDDVERRINYFRAMAGMTANIDITPSSLAITGGEGPNPPAGTTKETAAQAAAFMLSCNSDEYRAGGGVTTGSHDPHDPPTSWLCDNSTARNGAYYSSLAVGAYGPGAIDAYMDEDDLAAAGAENNDVGHRRFILFSRLQELATGDVTQTPSGSNPYYAANALYVFGNLLAPPSVKQYIAWPSSGYFPEPLLPIRWSLSYPEADFSTATVTVTDADNASVATTIVSDDANYGDNTLVWKLNSSPPSAGTADQTYNVTISNIMIDGSAESHSYSVTIINPDRILETPTLSGSTSPPDTGANYFFDSVNQASAYHMQVSEESAGSWIEGAKNSTSAYVIDGTESTYDLRVNTANNTGKKGFHIGLTSTNFQMQYMQLNRQIIPAANSDLTFHRRKRRMGTDTRARAEVSTDDGNTWTELWGINGTDDTYDTSFTQETISLSAYAGQIIQIRFSVERPSDATSAYYPADGNPGGFGEFNGIHIDDIEVTGDDDELINITETDYLSSDTITMLNTTTAGIGGSLLDTATTYRLRLRAKVGCHWFPYGPSIEVTPVDAATLTSYEIWFRGTYPIIGNFDDDYDGDGVSNGLEHIFGLSPLDPSDAVAALQPTITGGNLVFSHTVISGASLQAECSTTMQNGTWNSVTVTISGGTATASIPLNEPSCFFRWLTTQP